MLDAPELAAGSNVGLGTPQRQSTPALLERLVEAATAASHASRERARSTLENAIALLTAGHDYSGAPRPCPPRGGLAPWQARRVATYVRENISTSLRAGELSKLLRLSYSHFNRAFKVSFHETPTSYIMRQRMSLAQEKLLTTDHGLSRVALECGLCDQAHFSRMFRRVVGSTPRMWRRQFGAEL
jgi:AraC family transcriptional regulator